MAAAWSVVTSAGEGGFGGTLLHNPTNAALPRVKRKEGGKPVRLLHLNASVCRLHVTTLHSFEN